MNVLSKIKLALFALLTLLLIIIVFQNLSEIEVRLLFATMTMPQAALIATMLLVGFLMGLFANAMWRISSWRSAAKANRSRGSS
ncbi:MAG: LapA family protein [Planctomycetales bacterium]|nr:LapA family protein [Planctomycetales bacterium]